MLSSNHRTPPSLRCCDNQLNPASSLISEWRKQAAAGAVEGLGKKRGRPGPDAKDRKIAELEAENERLRRKIDTQDKVIEVQGKVSALLEHLSESADTETRSKL